MIGRRIHARPPVPFLGLASALIALILLASAAGTGKVDFAIGAIVPAMLAAASFLTLEPSVTVEFNDHGLEYERRGESGTIGYHEIERVWTPRRKLDPDKPGGRRYPIVIGHPKGVLHLHRKLDDGAEVDEVYRHLFDRVPLGGTGEVHEDLAEYLAEQRAEFGDDRVWAYRASTRYVGPNRRRIRAMALAAIVGGIAWIVLGVVLPDRTGWAGGGVLVAFYGGIVLLATFASGFQTGRPRFKRWKDSSLVVGPLGLALVQGEVRGEMKWDELRDVKLSDPRAFRLYNGQSAGRGVSLKIDGATIFVPDIYDRPIVAIHRAITSYWR